MSAKEKYLRRLLTEAEFYMNNIDGDDPVDLVGDAMKGGSGTNPIDSAIAAVQEEKGSEEVKHEDANATTGEAKFLERIEEAEKLIKDNLFEKETFRILSRE